MSKYIPQEFEKKWQKKWREEKLADFEFEESKSKYYTLVELPYTSGDLHIGHWFTFTVPDVLSRYKRMKGFNVFFPIGYDAFGLPAENAAIKRKIHPQDWTMKNIETMTTQFQTMGTMLNWSDVVITCLPEYYLWNQWIFIKMFERGLAYRGKMLSNWCETDQTVLANENIENGKCWRCGNAVIQKEVEQWFLKITDYADKLVWPESPKQDWPMSVRVGQNNWIGRKEGINITYQIKDTNETITCFTTRPDTNFGATFIVIAPEHPLVKKILNDKKLASQMKDASLQKIKDYLRQATQKTEEQRKVEAKDKTGVFTGFYALNQLNGKALPIWISDFVLMNFGTGAVVGVPGHDMRDFEFAHTFGLEIVRVVVAKDGNTGPITKKEQIQEEEGTMINSDFLNGMDIHRATKKIMDYLEEKGWGKRVVIYHLHDWSVSRQRYWGTPVPMIHCEKCGIVPEKNLPVELPYKVDFTPKGKPPLATNEAWLTTTCPNCGGEAKRDAETLDTFFDSAWYWFRYLSPHYTEEPFDRELAKKLTPVDVYFGGSEHTLGHTLYARFFTKFFKDLGLIDYDEFAQKRVQHGVVLGPDGNRMSKSKGNVINPDDVVAEYGSDAVRMYLCFMMPYEATGPWSDKTIAGVYRFLKRVWQKYESDTDTDDLELVAKLQKTIKKVGEDIENIKMNTAIAAMMEFMNEWDKASLGKENAKKFLRLLAPFAPHMTEEIWRSKLGEKGSIHLSGWPQFDEKQIAEGSIKLPVQVNGKVRAVIEIEQGSSKDAVVKKALEEPKIKSFVEGKEYTAIYVSGRILNLVI